MVIPVNITLLLTLKCTCLTLTPTALANTSSTMLNRINKRRHPCMFLSSGQTFKLSMILAVYFSWMLFIKLRELPLLLVF